MGLFSQDSSYLGIDIGNSSIKVVELTKSGSQPRLFTYGFSETPVNKLSGDWLDDAKRTAYVINKICRAAGARSRSAVSALPTYSVFSSILNLSKVANKDLAGAVHWEAKKVIPLPLEEMILDWRKFDESAKDNIKVLLTGAPKALVRKYIDIFKEARINLISLETETFALIRSLVGNDKSCLMLVEIGASTTDISVVEKGIPVLNRSLDIGGRGLTQMIAKRLNIDADKAEQFKYDLGISSLGSKDSAVPEAIAEAIGPMVNEIKFALNLYQGKNPAKVEKIILSGGSALIASLPNYLSKLLDIKVIVGDPWSRLVYPDELKLVLNEIGPRFTVAVGLALRGME